MISQFDIDSGTLERSCLTFLTFISSRFPYQTCPSLMTSARLMWKSLASITKRGSTVSYMTFIFFGATLINLKQLSLGRKTSVGVFRVEG